MKQTMLVSNKVPTANIAVNKSRLRVYNHVGNLPTYYLQKGQEFEIELFNPTSDVVLAKISLNGNTISQGGLVLNPGQRVFLDRYLDVAKKFLFDTYEVGKSAEVMEAIKDNGDFKVEFFRESQPIYIPHQPIYRHYNTNQWVNIGDSNYGSTCDNNTLNLTGTINSCATTTTTDGSATFTSGIATMDSLKDFGNDTLSSTMRRKLLKEEKTLETGRVEKGSNSDQQLKTVNKTFEFFAFHTLEYKMLPISQKVNTVEDINVKRYCVNCAHKLKKEYKFCPVCATKI